jgi:hypothetical protein
MLSTTLSASMKRCPFCAEEIQDAAIVCRFCNADLVKNERQPPSIVVTPAARTWSPGVAAVLSLVIPGAGQMYKGQVGQGIAWLLGVILGYAFFIVPGLILHLSCIVTAASGSPNPQASEAARLEQERARAAEFPAAKAAFQKAERKQFSTPEKIVGLGLVVAVVVSIALSFAILPGVLARRSRSNARPTTTTTTRPPTSAGPRRPTSALTFTCAGIGSNLAEFIPGDIRNPVDNLRVIFTKRPTPTEVEAALRQCIDAASKHIRIDYEMLVNVWVGENGPLPLIDGSRHLAYDPKTNKVQTMNERSAKAPASRQTPPTPERSAAPLSPPTAAPPASVVQQWGPPPNQLIVNVTERDDGWQIRNLHPGYTWERCEAGIGASSAKLPPLPPNSAVVVSRSGFKPLLSGATSVADVWITCKARGQTYMATSSDQ